MTSPTEETEPFRYFDADNHIYEPPGALLDRLPDRYGKAIRFVLDGKREVITIQGRMIDFIPNPTFEVVAEPGAFIPYYSANNPEGLSMREMAGVPIKPPPSYRDDPGARLKLLDEQGVDRVFVYPTLVNLVEQSVEADPDLTHAVVHSLNEWLHETWSFDYHDRIYMVPVITLGLVDEAIKELEWVLARGARAILIRPAPPEGRMGHRSFALPEFDPFWARVEEANIPLCIHAAHSIIEDYIQLWEPDGVTGAFGRTSFHAVAKGHRDIHDAIASLICHGALTRFPGLRVASVENGADWLAPLAHALDRSYRMEPQQYEEHPLEVLRRNVYVSPFWEDDLRGVAELIGTERIMFGSDYPHPEGLANPREYLDQLDDFSQAEKRMILHDNALRFLTGGGLEK
jgi:predicted TIM-barrel fold metal-dependent hydrolase